MMDTNQLHAFDQVVRHGSFSKAARILDLSQPTITIRIQTLEREVGGKLFIRKGQQLELTELGRSFLPYARQALTVLSSGIETAQLTMEGKKGQLTIGTLPSLATGFFTSTIEQMRETHPNVGITIHTGHNQEIVEMLYDGLIKLGFMTSPFYNTDLVTLLHIKEPLIAVTYPTHPLLKVKDITVNDVMENANPFIHVDWSTEIKQWQARFKSKFHTEFEVPPQTAHDLVLRGVGIALLTETFVARDLSVGNVVKVPVNNMPSLYRESVLVCLSRDKSIPSAYEEFLQIFRKQVGDYSKN